MRLLRTRWAIIIAIIILLGAPSAWLLARDRTTEDATLVAKVKKGEFKVNVTTAGELRARKFVQITVPANSNQADAYQMKIASIVPEGTVVKEGDVVAELDRSTIAAKLAEVSLALTKAQAVYEQATLDSTLNLSKAREEIRTMDLGLEEKKLAKEQSIYEAPTIRRQADIDYTKAERALAQAKIDYKTKTEQAKAKMREVGADLDRQRNKLAIVQEVMANFTIKAPAGGMVIYVKEWNGKKKSVGSQVSSWEPAVATLPDLTQMESVTYVNEIDVRKIAVNQPVMITLDADPTKKLPGVVASVANVGEQRPNSDSKVFEVKVTVTKTDTTLRPGMTTGNGIETYKVAQALYVPIEAVTNEGGISYVYKRDGQRVTKQEIETGAMNDDQVIVQKGLALDDRVLLSAPADKEKLQVIRLPGSVNRPPNPAGGDTAVRSKIALPKKS
ncbi:MAG: efflux RND transporter periplasmic adaptor subunit [Gemmatimonadota bacterium]|nr:efflux RND transporter periplasmic adaptor subunit [Gemmatimonadota bacterium]